MQGLHAQEVTDSLRTEVGEDSLEGIKFYRSNPVNRVSGLTGVRKSRLYQVSNGQDKTTVTWDSLGTYKISRTLYGKQIFIPQVVSFENYIELKKKQQQNNIRFNLIAEGKSQQEEKKGLLDLKISVPGGENSAFSTIFGSNEVNLRVNGSANMNVGATVQKLDDGTLPEDLRTRIDPTFNQNLQLNIQGTIGSKLTIATDWDTERQFDFENRLSIVYKGFEDEIIKSIEMGNVAMETGNSLVTGGSALFGIKAITELGPLKVTTVVSQQKGESNTQTISGGSQEQSINITPADYEDGKHFFIDYYNRQEFENALADPQNILQPYQVSELYVYVRRAEQIPGENSIQAIALLDLGVNDLGNGEFGLPGNNRDRFTDQQLDSLRASNSNATNDDFNAGAQEYVDAPFELLEEGIDYTFNRALGFISLKSYINSGDAIAIAYVYTDRSQGGTPVAVGELNASGNDRRYLKLIRPGGMTTEDKAWPLTMRNIYSLGVSSVSPDAFELDIADTRGNVDVVNLPGRPNSTLLQDLGLDRLNSEGAKQPDNQIDFTGITLDAGSGRIMFPYLEPFGDRIYQLLDGMVADSIRDNMAFTDLYDIKAVDASRRSKNSSYTITGKSSGGVSGTYNLGFGLVEGSVKVFANNVELSEGTDYEVDYSFGLLTILNERYLASGQEINVEYESNQLTIIGQKNFTGIRAEYTVNDDIKLGSTFFKLKEQPLSDKIRIGNESINNTVIGLDANASFDTPWMTRFIDKVPLLQTKAPSSISFSGEFAQLRPGIAQTNAVQEAIDKNELYSDEENGLAFIDDFEGAEYNISFVNPLRWNLAAAPAAVPGYAPDETYFSDPDFLSPQTSADRKARADLRSQFSFYSIPRNLESIQSATSTAETQTVFIQDVFKGREIDQRQPDELTTFDVYYNPGNRGPYNYNMDLKNLLENEPQRTWGGVTAVIPPGQEDLVQNNIEFLEFWVQAILPNGEDPAGLEQDYDGKIYIDLGVISEDIIPNVRLNTEDGLASTLNNLAEDDPFGTPRSYIPPSPPVPLGQFSNSNRELEDVGLDGAPDPGTAGANGKDEGALFADFIETIRVNYGESSEMYQSVAEDPSNDNYVYYNENKARNMPLLKDRFYRMLGYHDGNTPESGGSDNKTAVTLKPDTEGLVSSSSIQQTNSYYQYELDFNPADVSNLQIDAPGTYIVDKISNSPYYRTWYLVRIPLSEYTRKFGDIDNFQNISYMRMWMSGYKKPFTLRFATYEFVGSQWKKITDEISGVPASQEQFRVSTINIEENANRTPFPYRQPYGSIRALNRSAQVQSLENEQSLVLSVEDLNGQELQMVKRVYPGKLNLLNYSNMRMFVHGEGFDARGEAELVVRIGSDLENNYYEYRQPVTPSPNHTFNKYPGDQGDLESDAEVIWLYDENSMNIVISAFNVLKQLRDDNQIENTEYFDCTELPGGCKDIIGDDTVDGAVIGIKGVPSLESVSEIALGIRNPYNVLDPNTVGIPSLDAEFWLNELRVSGFDNENGWAANAKSSVKLADFATVNANVTRKTNGFGGLNSRLGDREVSDQLGYSLSSTVNLHKLVPDRFGWSFPVTISTRRNTRTPKYLPNQGDIRLTDFVDKVNSDPNLTSDEKSAIINDRISNIETVNEDFSINVSSISKQNSRSKLAQYTLDNLKFSYNYAEGYSKNPQLQFQNQWNYKASVSYNLTLRRVQLIRPFKFTENIPVLKALSNLRFGYLPTSISASSTLTRKYDESRRKNLSDPTLPQSLNQTHAFTEQNNFGLNYSFTRSIPISFNTSTSFDLSSAGIRPKNNTGVDSLAYDLRPTFDVIKGVIGDTLSARRSTYQENYSASWKPTLTQIKALSWLSLSTQYSGGFQWTNSPSGSNLGSTVGNRLQLDNTVRMNTEKLLNGLGFIKKIKDQNKKETNERADIKKKRANEKEKGVADSLRTPPLQPNLFRDAKYLGRKVFLGLISLKDISANYKHQKNGTQVGYDGDSQIWYAFNSPGANNFSPAFGYRFGINDRIPESELIDNINGNNNIQLPANNSYSDKYSFTTRLTPFENISIDLDWSADIGTRVTESITLGTNNEFTSVTTESGTYTSSVWSFSSGYDNFFRTQLQTALDDIDDGSNVISDANGNGDGRSVLNRTTVQEDFRRSYLGEGAEGHGEKGFLAFPKPAWKVNWTRFERFLPFIGKFMSSATLSHGYRGNYVVDWSLNALTGVQPAQSLGSFSFIDDRGKYEPTSIKVEQRFQPLLKLTMSWKSGLRTDIGYNRNNISSFAISSKRVTEVLDHGFDGNISYTFRNVTLPFLPKIKNNIEMGIRGSLKNNTETTYKLDSDLSEALVSGINSESDVNQAVVTKRGETGGRNINATFTLGYQISSTITSNFEYTFSKRESNKYPTNTTHDIRFNIKIAIRSR